MSLMSCFLMLARLKRPTASSRRPADHDMTMSSYHVDDTSLTACCRHHRHHCRDHRHHHRALPRPDDGHSSPQPGQVEPVTLRCHQDRECHRLSTPDRSYLLLRPTQRPAIDCPCRCPGETFAVDKQHPGPLTPSATPRERYGKLRTMCPVETEQLMAEDCPDCQAVKAELF